MELSESERRRIYELLCGQTAFGVYSLSRFGSFFTDVDIRAKDYGLKLKDLLGAMSECIQLLPEKYKGMKTPVLFFPWGQQPQAQKSEQPAEPAKSLEPVVAVLRGVMPVGQPVKYRRVYLLLKRAGIAPEDYGCKKPSELMKKLSDWVGISRDAEGNLYYTLLETANGDQIPIQEQGQQQAAPVETVEEPTPVEEEVVPTAEAVKEESQEQTQLAVEDQPVVAAKEDPTAPPKEDKTPTVSVRVAPKAALSAASRTKKGKQSRQLPSKSVEEVKQQEQKLDTEQEPKMEQPAIAEELPAQEPATPVRKLDQKALDDIHALVLERYEKAGTVINAYECDEYLRPSGNSSDQFGYAKPYPLLNQLPFLRTQKRMGKRGVLYTEYVLEEYPPAAPVEPAKQQPQEEPQEELALETAPTPLNHWLCPPENHILSRLCEHTGLDRTKLWNCIVEDFKQAVTANPPRRGRPGTCCGYSFLLRFPGVDGGLVKLLVKSEDLRSGGANGSVHWQIVEIDYYSLMETKPFDRLGRYAYLGDEDVQWSGLAQMAQPEQWSTASSTGKWRLSILNSYITCRFNRLFLQNRIAYSPDGQMAAFHTGLMDQHYHDIYACFSPNTRPNQQKWALDGFCVPGAGRLGKKLVMDFNPLPQSASFIHTLEDLYFNNDRPMFLDDHHILVDHVERLPLRFLQDTCAAIPEAMEVVQALEQTQAFEQRAQLYEKLRKIVDQSPGLYNTMMQKLSAATDVARHQVCRDYKIGIPSYYVSKNNMNLLLPLSFRNDGMVDNALELELTSNGCYIGHSILTIEQAYMDARQISASTGSWLQEALRRKL